MNDEIIEALESTTPSRGNRSADDADVNLYRRNILRFLDELDGGFTVSEIREALDNWK